METTAIVERKQCEICGEPLTARPCVICQRCHTLHHLDCWHYNEGCSVYGCRSRCCEAPENIKVDGEIAIPEAISISAGSGLLALFLWMLLGGLILLLTGDVGAAFAISFVTLFWAIVIAALVRRFVISSYLIFNNKELIVERQWKLFKWDLTARKLVTELVPENVREVHFLRYTTLGHSVEQLFYVDESEERHPLYMRMQAAPWQRLDPDRLEAAADFLGNIVDAPVRTFHSISSQGKWSYLAQALQFLGMKPKAEPQLLPPAPKGLDEGIKGKKKGIIQAPQCPACHGILTTPVIECALCKVIVHEHCWEEARGCPLAGCESRRGEAPAKPPSKLDEFSLIEARGPYETFNPKYLIVPAVLIPITIALGAISKVLMGISAALLFAYFIIFITLFFWYYMVVRREYRFSPKDGTIMLTYKLLGMAVKSSILSYARADNIVEVYYESHPGMLMRTDELSIGLSDGSRHIVYRSIPPTTIVDFFSSPTLSSEKVSEMAERLAAFGNCTVRMIRHEEELPGKEEIRRLGEAKGVVS